MLLRFLVFRFFVGRVGGDRIYLGELIRYRGSEYRVLFVIFGIFFFELVVFLFVDFRVSFGFFENG